MSKKIQFYNTGDHYCDMQIMIRGKGSQYRCVICNTLFDSLGAMDYMIGKYPEDGLARWRNLQKEMKDIRIRLLKGEKL